MNNIFERSIGLLEEENFKRIKEKIICIFGLGGVGGTALEALARTGFTRFIIVDFDVVDPSNINRQILFNFEDISISKVDAAFSHLTKINPGIQIERYKTKAQEFDFNRRVDFVVDAIDDCEGKLYIAKHCIEKNIPFIVSLGMANRFDPTKVKISTLNKTCNDPLARKIRYLFKQSGLILSNIPVVWSDEEAESNEKLNSIMTVPSSAGLSIAYYVVKYFLEEKWLWKTSLKSQKKQKLMKSF